MISLLLLPSMAFASFSDVPSTHPNYEAINYAQEQGIVTGYPDGTFKPDQPINRAEFVKIVILSEYTGEKKKILDMCRPAWRYNDVPFDAWYGTYLCRANDSHYVGGYPDGSFRPENNINLAQD